MDKTDLFNKLRYSVENSLGRKIRTPKDFEYLAMRIFNTTKQHISPTTLKRFWGYIDKDKDNHTEPRIITLNILSEFVGYKDWDSFRQTSSANGTANSDFINSKSLRTQSLAKGEHLRLIWNPDRSVTIKYMGQDMFIVEESVNSKLQCGDIFICNLFIENQPLLLTNLIRKDMEPVNYVCGRNGGVKFEYFPYWGG